MNKGRQLAIWFSIVVYSFQLPAQSNQNLLRNGDFETLKSRVKNPSFSDLSDWNPLNNSRQEDRGSPDLYSRSNRDSIPKKTCEKGYHGKKMVGLSLFEHNQPRFREYIGGVLKKELIKSKTYSITLMACFQGSTYYGDYQIDDLQVYLSQSPLKQHNNEVVSLSELGELIKVSLLTNSKGWNTYSKVFRLNVSDVRYLTIGEFREKAGPDYVVDGEYQMAYYFLDNITIAPIDQPAIQPMTEESEQNISRVTFSIEKLKPKNIRNNIGLPDVRRLPKKVEIIEENPPVEIASGGHTQNGQGKRLFKTQRPENHSFTNLSIKEGSLETDSGSNDGKELSSDTQEHSANKDESAQTNDTNVNAEERVSFEQLRTESSRNENNRYTQQETETFYQSRRNLFTLKEVISSYYLPDLLSNEDTIILEDFTFNPVFRMGGTLPADSLEDPIKAAKNVQYLIALMSYLNRKDEVFKFQFIALGYGGRTTTKKGKNYAQSRIDKFDEIYYRDLDGLAEYFQKAKNMKNKLQPRLRKKRSKGRIEIVLIKSKKD